ncbi:MAG: MotA/TolQ/ExbB proton channel family protein [Rickettsiales bacterium]|nr:MotA/TolQ/ExbB proton channel family protein [Rickettsiales bacterium]
MDIEVIQKGGIVMGILIALSVYALAVIFYKIQQFIASGVFNNGFIDPVMQPIKRGELTEASLKLGDKRGPVARIMRVSIDCIKDRHMTMKSRESEIARVGSQEVRYLESYLRGLEMVATTAPLLGLLGTVIGMVRAFSKLGEAGSRVDPSMLAGGIWEALLTTVGGLAVAIPAIAAYYIFDGIIEKVRATMKDVTVQILALEDMFLRNEEEQRRIEEDRRRNADRAILDKHELQRKELLDREEALRNQIEEQAKAVQSLRGTPSSTSTLRLLNPSYTKFG